MTLDDAIATIYAREMPRRRRDAEATPPDLAGHARFSVGPCDGQRTIAGARRAIRDKSTSWVEGRQLFAKLIAQRTEYQVCVL